MRPALAASALAVAVLLARCSSDSPSASPTVGVTVTTTPAPAPTVTVTQVYNGPADTPTADTPTADATAQITDGTFVVGTEVAPGIYRTEATGGAIVGCYWARLSGLGGTTEEIIANGNPSGPTTVEISATDAAFTTNGCEPWIKVG